MPPKEEPTLQEVLVRVLDSRVPTGGAGKRKTSTRRELVLEMLLRKAEEGHPRMMQLVLELLATVGTSSGNTLIFQPFTYEEMQRRYGGVAK
jgi:hypothetical protein